MTERIPARWYFDLVSPFAYLHLKRFSELHPALDIEFVPVLFAGLLKHWDNKGPAELAPKRLHTYRSCVWAASQHGIPFRMPPRHPFNPLHGQRLLVALGAPRAAVEAAYDFIWGEGRDLAAEWPLFCARLDVGIERAAALIGDPQVKQALADNTAAAAAQDVFGVPTLAFRGQNFWGSDTIAWANAFIDNPRMFDSGEMQRAAAIEVGAARKELR
jgi:2-hydroxychromene-2-carboxylate isomerase